MWIDADVTIDLLCSDLLGGADIGGKVLFLGLVCESGELLSGVARRQCVAPRVRTRQPAHVVTHESRLSRGGFAVEKGKDLVRAQRIAAGRQRLAGRYNLAACHAQRVRRRVGQVSAGGMPILVGWLQHQAVLQHVVVRGVADVVLDDGVVPVKDGDLARRTVRGAGAPAVGIDRRLQEFTNSVVPLQKRVELTTAGRWGRGLVGRAADDATEHGCHCQQRRYESHHVSPSSALGRASMRRMEGGWELNGCLLN